MQIRNGFRVGIIQLGNEEKDPRIGRMDEKSVGSDEAARIPPEPPLAVESFHVGVVSRSRGHFRRQPRDGRPARQAVPVAPDLNSGGIDGRRGVVAPRTLLLGKEFRQIGMRHPPGLELMHPPEVCLCSQISARMIQVERLIQGQIGDGLAEHLIPASIAMDQIPSTGRIHHAVVSVIPADAFRIPIEMLKSGAVVTDPANLSAFRRSFEPSPSGIDPENVGGKDVRPELGLVESLQGGQRRVGPNSGQLLAAANVVRFFPADVG